MTDREKVEYLRKAVLAIEDQLGKEPGPREVELALAIARTTLSMMAAWDAIELSA